MKNLILILLFCMGTTPALQAQSPGAGTDIYALIADYSDARQSKDQALLDRILASDVDQLVSSGEWRNGKTESLAGMMRSSRSHPGERTITVDRIRFLNPGTAIADARYEIRNADGTSRKMWSTFVVVYQDNAWKISAIRNMLPAVSK